MGGIVTWLSDLWNTITNGFKDIIDWFVSFPEMIGDVFDKWFNPNSDQLNGDFEFDSLLAEKFKFIEQVKTSLNGINKTGGVLQLPIVEVFGYKIDINGNLIEPFIPKVRSGISVIFWVMYFLCCFRMISGVFNIGVGKSSSAILKRGDE